MSLSTPPVADPGSAFPRPESSMSEPPQASTPPKKPKPVGRPSRPVPVRKLMREESRGEEGTAPHRDPAARAVPPPTRHSHPEVADDPGPATPLEAASEEDSVELQLEGESWRVTAAGRIRAGHPGDAGAPLLFLVFARSEAPGDPLREALAPGTDLGRFSHHELGEIFHRARAWSPPSPASSEDRGRGRGGRGGGRGGGSARGRGT